MNFKVYILRSEKLNRYYIGQTADLEKRINEHLDKKNQGSFTSKSDDWQLALSMQCESRDQAMKLERFIKRMKSSRFVKELIEDKTMQTNLIKRFR